MGKKSVNIDMKKKTAEVDSKKKSAAIDAKKKAADASTKKKSADVSGKKKTAAAPIGPLTERSKVPAAATWDVSCIYADEKAWRQDCAALKELLPRLAALQGSLGEAEKVKEALDLQCEAGRILDKAYAYAGLQHDTDTTAAPLQKMKGEAEALLAAFGEAAAFIEPELLALGAEKIETFFAAEPGLAEYRHYLENLLRLANHVLSAQEEALFAMGQLSRTAAADAFRSLTNADLTFPAAKDSKGNAVQVSNGNYSLLQTNGDRALRRTAFRSLHETYHKFRHTLAATLNGSARTAAYFAKAHRYPDTLTGCLAGDNIPTSLYDGLIAACHEHLEPLHEYCKLKKKALGCKTLHVYDLYAPLAGGKGGEGFALSYEKACALVEEALAPLGEEYCRILHEGLTSRWLDVYENRGKRSGAYSWSVYGVHPYVLLNYHPGYNSISTIAHEMGHALHSWFSTRSQSYINSEYTIFCAEIASTCNEILLLEHCLKKADAKQRLFLLNQYLEAVRTTVYRQTLFAEFERHIHGSVNSGRSLTAQELEDHWLELNRVYYGPALKVDEELRSEWSRIPHFYTPFYVYKYATGYAAASAFAGAILKKEEGAAERYLGFLRAGGSDYSLAILQKAGVDLTTAAPVTVTLQNFAAKTEELARLLGAKKG